MNSEAKNIKKIKALNSFDDFKDDWWNPKGRLRSLHWITPVRFEYFKKIVGDLKGKKVADIGCGGGLLSERFAGDGATVTAIDLSVSAIEAAKKHAKEEGLEIDYRVSSVEELIKGARKEFDMVLCSEVLEHVDDLEVFIKSLSLLLKDGGTLFFSTINKTLKAKFLTIFMAENILGLLPEGTHNSEKFIRPSRLVKLLEKNNVIVEEIKGMKMNPLTFKFKISKDTSVNYIGYAIKK
ncbi:MAG: bifunctional 2-polyprenyl-6-hydroxyphenol methylase/3-demethylubiquinol 3-O-methyltransferase UbiG [Deltaproteobacteria bacterium]|nr:bifunctional 2-polyprenyl-6-hydroxyphenol methylase/3-demethylubiquinol 3-O-methyltransferase UbiG [Deltaproteobacteria bacterium]